MITKYKNMIYIVVTGIDGRHNKIVAAKILRRRGYERLGNGYFFLKILKNLVPDKDIYQEIKWLKNNGMGPHITDTMKGFRTRYSPYP